MDEFPTFAEGDILLHLRYLPGFEPETTPLGDTGYAITVIQDEDDEMIHVLVTK